MTRGDVIAIAVIVGLVVLVPLCFSLVLTRELHRQEAAAKQESEPPG
jgi:hypothetical protein